MSKLTGKVAVVTGASKGIGAAIAKALAAEGASVVVNYASSKTGADDVVAAITKAGGKAVAVGGDVSKAAQAQGIIDAAIKNYGRLDILVNNSGVYEFAPVEAITEEQFHRLFNINVLGLLLTTQAAVKYLGEGASIINIGSAISRLKPAGTAVYTATKGAVDAITGVFAKEFGAKKIRVNSINPGIVETEGTTTAGFIGSDFEKGLVSQTPLGRTGQPRDIADIAVFLASDDSAHRRCPWAGLRTTAQGRFLNSLAKAEKKGGGCTPPTGPPTEPSFGSSRKRIVAPRPSCCRKNEKTGLFNCRDRRDVAETASMFAPNSCIVRPAGKAFVAEVIGLNPGAGRPVID